MTSRDFARWLAPIAAFVFVGGWIFGVVAFLVVGDETCTTTNLGIAGQVVTCTDTTAVSVILLMIVGLGATLGSLWLLCLRFLILSMAEVAENTQRRG
jgi:hypothetical protein